MKRIIIITILAVICGITAMAQDRPNGTHHSSGGDRTEFFTRVSVLVPVFDDPNIVVYGCEDAYYDVTVTMGSSIEFNDIIGRERGNTINYEFSTDRSYVITLTSLLQGTTIVWRLDNGVLNGSRIPNLGGVTNDMINGAFFLDY